MSDMDRHSFRLVLANDISGSACEAMRMNVAYNGVAEIPKQATAREKAPAEVKEAVVSEKPAEEVEGENNEELALNTTIEIAEEPSRYDEAGRREGCRGRVRVNEGDAW